MRFARLRLLTVRATSGSWGRVARGTDRKDSDLALLVTFDQGVGLLEHAKLVLELETLLGRKVDVASERGVRPKVRRVLEADAKIL